VLTQDQISELIARLRIHFPDVEKAWMENQDELARKLIGWYNAFRRLPEAGAYVILEDLIEQWENRRKTS
jgi:hypothetical protein